MSSSNWLEVLYSAAPFWVQCREPDIFERAGHPAHVLLRAVQQVRDIRAPWPCAGISTTIAWRSLTIPGRMADRSQSRPSVVTTGRVRCPDYGGKLTSDMTAPGLRIACKELADMHSTSLEDPSTARRKDSALGSFTRWNASRAA